MNEWFYENNKCGKFFYRTEHTRVYKGCASTHQCVARTIVLFVNVGAEASEWDGGEERLRDYAEEIYTTNFLRILPAFAQDIRLWLCEWLRGEMRCVRYNAHVCCYNIKMKKKDHKKEEKNMI